ncbi:type I-F CRISPR-associated protein Cas7f/Csy3 [Endozoicomonas ascidiicola]|uniref:type I-F CRISPR-associated protein Cas7f/Csy3 n=1 Tax=Endozoicomonas ascidiicola TaxID=1698521 RepID=UPI0008374BD7|nr:type I-F CRISPR-associated protein Cas7f/Csy3 [Endozoicomonas ascidiicola]USN27020.1 type I-F CRISPR-associated protein Cas7/Csy3 [synthetic construct]
MILPTILTYEKSLAPSVALMFAKTYDNKKVPIEVYDAKGRGAQTTFTACHGTKDTDLGEWLPVRQDICHLPHDASELIIEFPLKYSPNSMKPGSCNVADWTTLLKEMALLYGEKGGYLYQAYCQMDALFQAVPFWRNKDAESMTLRVMNISDSILPPYVFTNLPCSIDELIGSDKQQLDSLIKNIESALTGKRNFLRLRVIAELKKDILEEVHPSQQFIEKLPEAKKEYLHRQGRYQKSRQYVSYNLGNFRQAMLRPTKIGAGLRPDRWNDVAKEVPVSVYGLDPESHAAIRGRGTKNDFYTLISNIKKHIETLRAFDGDMFNDESILTLGNIHFIMANLIKGGVYNRESSKTKNKGEPDECPIDLSNP